MLAIAQPPVIHASHAGAANLLTLGAAPRPGNWLFSAIFCIGTATPGIDDTEWAQVGTKTFNTDKLVLFKRYVKDGAPLAHLFELTGTVDQTSGILFDVVGAHPTSPLDNWQISNGETATTHATPSLTPSVLGCLPVSFLAVDDWTCTVSSVSAGWGSSDANTYANNNFHPADMRHKALTTDLITAISNSFVVAASSASGGVNDGLAALLLIAPAPAPTVRYKRFPIQQRMSV